MTKEELLKEIMKLPKVETNNPISTMTSINVDDLMSAVDRLNKVPDYNDLLKENQELKLELSGYRQAILEDKDMLGLKEESQRQKEVIDKAINNSQYWIDYYTRLNSDERIALRLQENIDILKEVE